MVGTAVLAVAAGWGAPASAAEPMRVTVPIAFAFVDSGLSADCGFEVLVSAEGSVTATLHETGGGSALEVDHQMMRWTFEAPSTGGSYSFLSTITGIFDYAEGSGVGEPATVTLVGTFEDVPGASAAAGRQVFDSTIDHIGDEGFPVAFLGEPTSVTGRFPEADACAALR
jgi:hypothetical protein